MQKKNSPDFTYFIIVVCTVVFIFTLYLPDEILSNILSEYAVLPNSFFKESNYLPFFSYLFLHLNFQHLLSNMFVLFSIGRVVESDIGTLKFGLTYFAAGFLSGLFHVIFNQSSNTPVIGASGAVFGVIALLVLLMPFKFTSAMIIPMPGVLLGVSMLLLEVTAIILRTDPFVAHDVHLYGFLFGGLASFMIDFNRAMKGLIISIFILMGLYYWVYLEGRII
jgi:membrane associated rhomboid family serine protease